MYVLGPVLALEQPVWWYNDNPLGVLIRAEFVCRRHPSLGGTRMMYLARPNFVMEFWIAVWLLQASFGVRVRVREPDGVDEPVAPGGGPGLRAVEQRPGAAVLRVRVLQGRPPGGAARPVAQGQHRARRRHRRARLPLPRRLQRIQERAGRVALPPLQVVMTDGRTAGVKLPKALEW